MDRTCTHHIRGIKKRVKLHTNFMRIYKYSGVFFHYLIFKAFSNISSMLPENFRSLDIFSGFNHTSIDLIIPLMEVCTFSGDTVIYRQDQEATYFYILVSGSVVVKHKPYDGDEITIARVTPEDVIGWSAALGRPCYTSSAYAEVHCDAVRVEVANMREFCRTNPQLGRKVMEKLAQGIAYRLKSTYDEVLALLFHGMGFLPEN